MKRIKEEIEGHMAHVTTQKVLIELSLAQLLESYPGHEHRLDTDKLSVYVPAYVNGILQEQILHGVRAVGNTIEVDYGLGYVPVNDEQLMSASVVFMLGAFVNEIFPDEKN